MQICSVPQPRKHLPLGSKAWQSESLVQFCVHVIVVVH
jgi:hypothetical protein